VFLYLGQNSLSKELLIMLCPLSLLSSKRLMGFGKYIGFKDLQEIWQNHNDPAHATFGIV